MSLLTFPIVRSLIVLSVALSLVLQPGQEAADAPERRGDGHVGPATVAGFVSGVHSPVFVRAIQIALMRAAHRMAEPGCNVVAQFQTVIENLPGGTPGPVGDRLLARGPPFPIDVEASAIVFPPVI